MGKNSKIEWTHHTANLWWGCTEVHDGCDNCYARAMAQWWGHNIWGNTGRRRIMSIWDELNKYQRAAAKAGEVQRVFVGSMMDIFEKSMPLINPEDHYNETEDLRQEFFTQISMGLYPNLLFLLLTKRASNIPKMVPAGWLEEPEANVMYGTSISRQQDLHLVKTLLKTKGRHFLSIEPLLSKLDLSEVIKDLDWVIVGGESGRMARPMHIDWVRSLRDQCVGAGVPFFFKQWGEWVPEQPAAANRPFYLWTGVTRVFHYLRPDGRHCAFNDYNQEWNDDNAYWMAKAGKSHSGHDLDGEVFQQWPK